MTEYNFILFHASYKNSKLKPTGHLVLKNEINFTR